MEYQVSTVASDADGNLVFGEPRVFANYEAASRAAKKLARDADDCVRYGPESVAFVGADVTAVISWGR